MLMTFSCSVALALIAYFGSHPLIALFGVEGEALAMGIDYICLVAPWFIVFGVYQAYVGLLQGAGDASFTAFCTLSSLGLRVFLAYFLDAIWGCGYQSICYSMPFGYGYVFILCLFRYHRGRWKEKAVR